MKGKNKKVSIKKKTNILTDKETFVANGDNIEENIIILLKNNNKYRK